MLLSFPNVSSACSYSTMEGDLETPNTGGGGVSARLVLLCL